MTRERRFKQQLHQMGIKTHPTETGVTLEDQGGDYLDKQSNVKEFLTYEEAFVYASELKNEKQFEPDGDQVMEEQQKNRIPANPGPWADEEWEMRCKTNPGPYTQEEWIKICISDAEGERLKRKTEAELAARGVAAAEEERRQAFALGPKAREVMAKKAEKKDREAKKAREQAKREAKKAAREAKKAEAAAKKQAKQEAKEAKKQAALAAKQAKIDARPMGFREGTPMAKVAEKLLDKKKMDIEEVKKICKYPSDVVMFANKRGFKVTYDKAAKQMVYHG